MFDDGLTSGVGTSVDDGRPVVDPVVLPDMLFATAQSENMLAAQKVLGASMLSESRFNAELDASGDVDKAWRIACNEIAVMLTCSRRTAEVHVEIGDALREFLPLTKAAFAAGELDYARVRKIVDGLTGVDPEAISALERRVLASAHRLPPGQLERDIERQLFAYDPDAAAERRRKMLEHRDVRTRADRHGLAQLQATLSASEAVEALGLINDAAGSVCNHDPRNASTRRADALVALLHGENGLRCQCGSETCEAAPTAAQSTTSSRRKPLLHIVCDLATLLGLTSDPASIDGYGPIDPDFARELATDSTWQALFVDLRAQAAGNRPRRQHAAAVLPPVTRPDRSGREPNGCGDRIRAIQLKVANAPDIVRRSDGHGAQPDPPPGALTYAPGAALAALVRAVDGHCRFPGCSVPANRCQLDHVTEFDPSDPKRGGWTIASNLQCLCRHHHQVKTYRLWTPVMLEDRAIHWTDNTSGLTAVTVPERI